MKLNTKLILLIRYLAEMPGVLKLVRQVLGFTNKNRQLDLLNFLFANADDLDTLEKHQIMAGIAPKYDLTDSAYRNHSSQLAKLLEETMAGFEMKENPFALKTFIAHAYNRMGLDKPFFKAVKEGIKKGLPDDELERHLALARGNRMIFFHPKANLHVAKEYQQHFDDWYLNACAAMAIQGLKYYCISMTRKFINGIEPLEGLEENFESFITWLPKSVSNLLVVQLYLKCARAYQKLNRESYLEFKALFIENVGEIHGEKSDLIVNLINVLYLIDSKAGRAKENFEIMKLGVENNCFVTDGYLASNHFNNIVYIGCEMRELEWTEKFIANHLDYLHLEEDSLENIQCLINCFTDFAKEDYDEVLPSLYKIKYKDYTYGCWKHVLQHKCFYESEKAKETYNHVDLKRSFREYLRRKANDKKLPISTIQIDRYRNFIDFFDCLINYPFNSQSRSVLLEQLNAYKGEIHESRWFREKINALN